MLHMDGGVRKVTEAVLLAGGKSRRMGTDKLLLPQNGSTVLYSAFLRFSEFFDNVYISVGERGKYPEIPAEHLVDSFPNCGPMAGLLEGLRRSQSEGIFLSAADLPFSDPELALWLMKACGEYDICITEDLQGRYEPLFGFYRKNVENTVYELLREGNFRLTELYRRHSTLILTPQDLPKIENDRAFANMNCPEDFQRLLGKNVDWIK